jgi:cobalamin synthase
MFVPLAGAGVAFVFSFFVFRSVFKGITGDGLGFGVEMGELLHLLVCYLACPFFFTNTFTLS